MANVENTAINELIAEVTGQPRPSSTPPADAREDARPPALAALAQARPMHTTYPASMPVAAPFERRSREDQRPLPPTPLPTSYPVVPRAMLPDIGPPSAPPPPPAVLPAASLPAVSPPAVLPAASLPAASPPAASGIRPSMDPAAAQSWRPSRAGEMWTESERTMGTLQLRKPSELRIVISRLVLPIALLVTAGVAIGGFVAFHGAGPALPEPAAPAPRTAPSAQPAAPALPEPVAEPATPPPPSLVEVRIDSTPSGATVTLIDGGKSQFVGTTPLNAAVDPSREYDLVFSYQNRLSWREHLDPKTTRRVAVVLGRRAPARPADSPRGEGTLMISSKPPCEIVIDGKPTGLTTPQRAIALAAGAHKITLINRENDLRKTITVQITASATEKVIEDLMK